MKIKILFYIILIIPSFTKAQIDTVKIQQFNNWENKVLQATYQNGYVFPTNDFVRGVNAEKDTIDAFQAFSLTLSKQTIGNNPWELIYNYPNYGIGLYLASFQNPEEIGLPIAFYGYFNAPFHRWSNLSLNYDLGLGIAFNWKNYSPANTYNIAIGSKQTAYINLGINTQYQISNRLFTDIGFSVSHFSNGRLKEPNFGLNIIAPKFSIKYNLLNKAIDFKKQTIPKFKAKNEIYLSTFTGIKNILYDSLNIAASEKFEGESFYVFGVSSVFNRQINYKSKIGFGFTISYDASIDAQVTIDKGEIQIIKGKNFEKLQLSFFPSYELVVNKVSVFLQPSIYLYRKKLKNQSPVFYQRIGLKYNFYNNFYVGLNLRAYNYHVSDFLEWNISYCFY